MWGAGREHSALAYKTWLEAKQCNLSRVSSRMVGREALLGDPGWMDSQPPTLPSHCSHWVPIITALLHSWAQRTLGVRKEVDGSKWGGLGLGRFLPLCCPQG